MNLAVTVIGIMSVGLMVAAYTARRSRRTRQRIIRALAAGIVLR